MNTGIYIRAKVDGKWDSVDIGDSRLPDSEVIKWLHSKNKHFVESVVMVLLGRKHNE